jgi:3-hydroxyisobutyrate dehydrogenase-like beta-hydroxyacid dehydrogenase
MSKLTMIGLGAMGSALAATLIDKGHDLTVWNRSAPKPDTIDRLGVEPAGSLASAIEASPVILICIHGYEATRQLLDDPQIIPLLRGRLILQMSTGTPAEARDAEAWIQAQGGRYLDCAIMVYPPNIGTPAGQLLLCGERQAYDEATDFIGDLGGDIRYLGAPIGAAAALDLAIVTRLVTITVATVYGIHLCEAENVPLEQFTAMYPEGDRSHHLAGNIEQGRYDQEIAATVGTSIEVISSIGNLARAHGINSELPDFLLGLYHRAAAAGYHDLDNAVLIEVLRANQA